LGLKIGELEFNTGDVALAGVEIFKLLQSGFFQLNSPDKILSNLLFAAA
jgi:hypothetical protein